MHQHYVKTYFVKNYSSDHTWDKEKKKELTFRQSRWMHFYTLYIVYTCMQLPSIHPLTKKGYYNDDDLI